jgi:hypothetical protein
MADRASFVVKKKGLLASQRKYGTEAGEGHGYLKNWLWWTGMIMMIVGEVSGFSLFCCEEACADSADSQLCRIVSMSCLNPRLNPS